MLALPQAMKKGARLTSAVLVGVVLVTLVIWRLACGDCLRDVSASGPVLLPSLMAAGGNTAEPSDRTASPAVVSPNSGLLRPMAQVEEALFVKGSLRGTDYPSWGTLRGEPVKPNRALRDRFDYYLLALNEASLAELTALVRMHAERDLGAQAAADILAVWERYLKLQQHAFKFAANPADPSSMQAALQEHQQVRQSTLGMHWAQAFYGEEEKLLANDLTQALSGQPAKANEEHVLFQPPPGTDPQLLHQQRTERFGAEAAQRLRDLDDEAAKWEQRLARARTEIDAIRSNPGYSPPQRDDAIARYLDGAYPAATERLRAEGLLGI